LTAVASDQCRISQKGLLLVQPQHREPLHPHVLHIMMQTGHILPAIIIPGCLPGHRTTTAGLLRVHL
jgi:hypothetical protein